MEGPQVGKKCYNRKVLQQMSDAKGFTQYNIQLENARCEADLMYAIFRRPQTVIPQLLQGFLEIIKKKNNPKLEQSRIFREAVSFLMDNPNADVRIKIFYVLWILNREPEAKELIKNAYLVNHVGNIWEGKCHAHFDKFIKSLAELWRAVEVEPFSTGTIIEVVRATVLCAEQMYLTK